ncbi:fasciclin domain-containing protein [Roseivirga sp. BDSF3-8]|uniref:fasciclin domain-containing protein n=1 Tax=Roseivirga sp. BDSF3-8 TaxID=3241598 RepID=UPI0035325A96
MNKVIDSLTHVCTRGYGLALLAGLFFLASCNDDNDSPLTQDNDLSEVIAENPELSSFEAASADIEEVSGLLRGTESYTVFAPDNEAFNTFLNGRSLNDIPENVLKNVLLNHVVAGQLRAGDLENGTLTTLGGSDITVARQGDSFLLNGNVRILAADIEASNGIIHVVNAVMDHEEDMSMGSIAEEVVNRDNLSTLEAILTSGNYDALLNAASDPSADLTLFAPDNEAFANLLMLLDVELGDIPTGVVEDILMYHILGESVMSGELMDGTAATTMLGEDITVMIDGGMVTLNPGDFAVMVEEADIEANNGVIHQIGGVLVPPSVQSILGTVVEPAYFSKDFTTLVAAVVKADLLGALLAADGVTLFAPTNQAFENAGINVDDLDGETLARVLKYHVLPVNVPAGDLVAMLDADYEAPVNQVSAHTLLGDNYELYFSRLNGMFYINGDTKLDPANIMTDQGTVHVLPEGVLMPPTMTIAEIVQMYASGEAEGTDEDGEFNVLLAALTRATNEGGFDFLGAVSNPEANLTVFAPTDEAFMKLLNITNLSQLEDIPVEVLTDVLQYHVIIVPFFSVDLLNNNAPATLYSSISIQVTDNLTIVDREDDNMDANIIIADVKATNGVIHAIDNVLLPFDLVDNGGEEDDEN